MTTRMRGIRRTVSLLALVHLLSTTGCALYTKGAHPLADVSSFPRVAADATSEKPLYITFDARLYADGRPAGALDHEAVTRLKDKLLGTLKQLRCVEVTEHCPTSPEFCRAHVSLKIEERFDRMSWYATKQTFFLFPTFVKITYECKAELRDDRNRLIGSYAFGDTCNATYQLFLGLFAPFCRNYPALITHNLYEQLAMAIAADLKKGTNPPGPKTPRQAHETDCSGGVAGVRSEP